MTGKKPEVDADEGEMDVVTNIPPTYQKLHDPIQTKIDEMFWAGKKLTFYLIESGADKITDLPPEYHIYLERIDTTVDDEPLFSMLETVVFRRAKRLWLNLQRLKACLEKTD